MICSLKLVFLLLKSWLLILIQIADASPNTSNQEINAASLVGSDSPSFPMLPESSQSNLEVSSAYIPLDQMRMIENINTLISEVCSSAIVVFCSSMLLAVHCPSLPPSPQKEKNHAASVL